MAVQNTNAMPKTIPSANVKRRGIDRAGDRTAAATTPPMIPTAVL